MSHVRRDLVGGVWGVAAGMGAILPSTLCAGGACASCFACVGVGGVVASIAAARVVLGRRSERGRPRTEEDQAISRDPSPEEGAT